MSSLKGKVALVTGAGGKRGMGRAIALRMAADGADVVIVDKDAVPRSIWPGDEDWGGLAAVAEEIKAQGRDVLIRVADVSSSQDVDDTVAEAMEKFGKIDILVNCVGIRGPIPTPVVELDEDIWRSILDINLTGAFLISKAVAKTMIPNGAGKKIVHISSMGGTKGYPGGSAYCASKHGVIGLAKTLALELAQYKINVNAVCPGAFDTNFRDDAIVKQAKEKGVSVAEAINNQPQGPPGGPGIPLGRMGLPEDVANLVAFLVSEESNYITGEAILINGGAE